MSRIYSREDEVKPEINKEDVVAFFEKRAEKIAALGPVRAVIYQDKNPDLAERRDAAEKDLLFPKLALSQNDRVLDAGCGTGRWAGIVIPSCGSYHGVDISPGLLHAAKTKYASAQNARFTVSSLDAITLAILGETQPFTCILSFGVFIYMNDDEALGALRALSSVAAPTARLFMREPISIETRLTLHEHFSEDMDQFYNAIYRTEAELAGMFRVTLLADGFKLHDSGDVYSQSDLNNRSDTKQKWFVWERP